MVEWVDIIPWQQEVKGQNDSFTAALSPSPLHGNMQCKCENPTGYNSETKQKMMDKVKDTNMAE